MFFFFVKFAFLFLSFFSFFVLVFVVVVGVSFFYLFCLFFNYYYFIVNIFDWYIFILQFTETWFPISKKTKKKLHSHRLQSFYFPSRQCFAFDSVTDLLHNIVIVITCFTKINLGIVILHVLSIDGFTAIICGLFFQGEIRHRKVATMTFKVPYHCNPHQVLVVDVDAVSAFCKIPNLISISTNQSTLNITGNYMDTWILVTYRGQYHMFFFTTEEEGRAESMWQHPLTWPLHTVYGNS